MGLRDKVEAGAVGGERGPAVLSAVSRHCTGVTPRQALLGPPSAKTPAVRPTHRGGGGLPGSLSAAQHQLSGWLLTIKTRLEEPATMPCVTPLNRMRFFLHAMLREGGEGGGGRATGRINLTLNSCSGNREKAGQKLRKRKKEKKK